MAQLKIIYYYFSLYNKIKKTFWKNINKELKNKLYDLSKEDGELSKEVEINNKSISEKNA